MDGCERVVEESLLSELVEQSSDIVEFESDECISHGTKSRSLRVALAPLAQHLPDDLAQSVEAVVELEAVDVALVKAESSRKRLPVATHVIAQ